MISYNDDFALMLIVILACLPLLLLVRGPRRQPQPAAADDWRRGRGSVRISTFAPSMT
jgi:hypothetical protein